MLNETKYPATLAGVNRAGNIKTVSAGFDGTELTGDMLGFQVGFIVRPYRLSPCMARLVCHLAHIGGKLA